MKSLLTYFLLALFTLTFAASSAQEKKIEARIDGLSCPYCAFGLEKKLKKIKGVRSVEIDLYNGLAVLLADSSAHITEAIVETQIERSGFTPREIIISDYVAEMPPVADPAEMKEEKEE